MSDPTVVSRRLVAVFAEDVEGYSRLMGSDEVGTLKALTERRAILNRIIGDHRGRIANTAGDSVLAESGSAVDAVQRAVAARAALAEANIGEIAFSSFRRLRSALGMGIMQSAYTINSQSEVSPRPFISATWEISSTKNRAYVGRTKISQDAV